MARISKQSTPPPASQLPGVQKMNTPPKQIRISKTSSAEVHYMHQIKTAVDYLKSVSGKEVAIVILDSYVREDSLISFALKYFQALLDPKTVTYYDNYITAGANKVQICSVTDQPAFEKLQLFTVGVSDEYFDQLKKWQERSEGLIGFPGDDFIN